MKGEMQRQVREWEAAHPADAKCPRTPGPARTWRIKRGIEMSAKDASLWAKYEDAMTAKRAALVQTSA